MEKYYFLISKNSKDWFNTFEIIYLYTKIIWFARVWQMSIRSMIEKYFQ